jgi:3-oxoacyl-[acyl-carrier-protein] synthase III
MNQKSHSASHEKNLVKSHPCHIAGVGSYVPERVLTNADLEKMVDTSDDWIVSRTGIRERRLAAAGECTSDLAAKAAARAMQDAGVTADQIDLIIVATITPDMIFPSTACLVQQKIGARRAAAFDLEAACSGFIYGLHVGSQFIHTGAYRTVLVIGAEKISSITDWADRNTCVLFGDGAGAAILQSRADAHEILTVSLGADGTKSGLIELPAGGSKCPASPETIAGRMHFLRMDGRETFKNAINVMCQASKDALKHAGIEVGQVGCIIPHQANQRIVDAVSEKLEAKPEQVFLNLQKYGNTSAASVAIALDEAYRGGRIKKDDYVLLVAFGSGLSWGAAVIRW